MKTKQPHHLNSTTKMVLYWLAAPLTTGLLRARLSGETRHSDAFLQRRWRRVRRGRLALDNRSPCCQGSRRSRKAITAPDLAP